MSRLLPLVLLAACQPEGAVIDDTPVVRDPVDAVVLDGGRTWPLDGWSSRILPGDVDGDGNMDIVLWTGTGIHGFLGDGTGGLEPFDGFVLLALEERVLRGLALEGPARSGSFSVSGIDVADMDGNGTDDLVISVQFEHDGTWHYVTGAILDPLTFAVFDVLHEGGSYNVGPSIVGDMDGDGLPELVGFGEHPAVYTSRGAVWSLGTGLEWVYYPGCAAMHLDGDDAADLVVFVNGGYGVSEIRTFVQTGMGLAPGSTVEGIYANTWAFGPDPDHVVEEGLLSDGQQILRYDATGITREIPASDAWLGILGMGDLDGDRHLDVLSTNGEVSTLFGSAPEGPLVPIPFTGPDLSSTSPVVVDLDADGLGDVVAIGWNGEDGSTFLSVWMNVSP